MDQNFLYPEEVDKRLAWPLGTASRLAKKGELPFYRLPDGSVRFVWAEIENLVERVPLRRGPVILSLVR